MAIPELVPRKDNDGREIPINVQHTTLGIDVLSRFICNTWDEATANLLKKNIEEATGHFDAVVIGAGMYGAYCAQQIWRAGGKVLILEAGPFLVSEHGQNLANIGLNTPGAILPTDPEASKTREQVWGIPWRGNQIFPGLAYCVGGKSLYWGGWSPRLTEDVLQDFPERTRQYLNENYENTEVQLGVVRRNLNGTITTGTGFIDETGNNGLTTKLREQINNKFATIPGLEASQTAPVAVQGDNPSSGLFSFDKFSSTPILVDAIREDAGRSKNNDSNRRLFLVPNCHVTRLNAKNGTVESLDAFVDNTFKTLAIPITCKVVLAMSCIESTRLALESFPTPLMGRNLMVHVRSNFAIRIPRSKFVNLKKGPVETAAIHVPGITPKGGRYHFQIVAGANRNNAAEEIWFRTIPDVEMLQGILKNQDSDYVALQFRTIGEMFGVKDNGTPNPEISWIDLSPETDEFGKRRAYVHLKTLPIDNELWDQMDEASIALAQALGEGETEFWIVDKNGSGRYAKELPAKGLLNTESDSRDVKGIRDALGTTFHECGTLWMGDNSTSSVTDYSGRFHHISNAYCVDQSIFTRGGSANPVPTGLTLARQVAEIITQQTKDNFTLEDGFTSLFEITNNDQRFPDWWEHFGDGGFVRLKNVLETEGNGIGLLVYTKQQFTNFTLKLEWRSFTIRNNSGVYLRLPKGQSDGLFNIKTGYEVQIDNLGNRPGDASSFTEENFNPFHSTGAIYPVHLNKDDGLPNGLPEPNGRPSKRNIPTKPLGEWNNYEIKVIGNKIKVILNGEEVLEGGEYEDRNNTYPQGFIALQNHSKGSRVQFRNIRIKEG